MTSVIDGDVDFGKALACSKGSAADADKRKKPAARRWWSRAGSSLCSGMPNCFGRRWQDARILERICETPG